MPGDISLTLQAIMSDLTMNALERYRVLEPDSKWTSLGTLLVSKLHNWVYYSTVLQHFTGPVGPLSNPTTNRNEIMALYKCIILLSFLIPLTLSCLQCDKDLRTMLWQIERAFIPALIKDHNLKTRARILVNGMYHRFFADYASNAYLGFIGVHDYEKVVKKAKKKIKALQKNPPAGKALLDTLVKYRATFARLLKKGLKKYKSKACSPKKCGVLKKKVLDCTRCKKVEPSCFKPHRCKGERIRRVAVEDKGEEKEKKEKDHSWLLIVGLVTVGIAGLLLLAGMVIGAIIYRRSTERLMHKLNPNMAKKRKVSGKVHSSGVG